MNYIPRTNVQKKHEKQYEEIRKNYETNHLREIYQTIENFPKIRFKYSMLNKMGLSS
jgi:hypothetical protein